jgi:catechol 2,3-dioxygenase-like lactoylglutathione lyase family enzyme
MIRIKNDPGKVERRMYMQVELQHIHIFASDLEATIGFWQEMFGAEVLVDPVVKGNRSVVLGLGSGRLAIYDRPSSQSGTNGAVHHIGLQTDDLDALMAHMQERGFQFTEKVNDGGFIRFIFAEAPDGIRLDLFQIIKEKLPKEMEAAARVAFNLDKWT